MPPKSGDLLLLKAGDGQPTEIFTTIAGLRATALAIAGQMVNVTDKDSNKFRELLAGGGEKALSLSADGVFEDATGQIALRSRAAAGTLHNYQIDDGTTVVEGTFQITAFDHAGDQNAEQTFSVTLESSGAWTVT